VWEGRKVIYSHPQNKLQHIQLPDTTGTSNGTGFCGQMKLKLELFGSKNSRWVSNTEKKVSLCMIKYTAGSIFLLDILFRYMAS